MATDVTGDECVDPETARTVKGDAHWMKLCVLFFAIAFIVVLPFVIWGYPEAHDPEFHLTSWLEVVRQWHEGVVVPRWAGQANFGYGEPRFIYYPPISILLGAMLAAVIPVKLVIGTFVLLVLVLAGFSAYLFSVEFLASRWAMLAAATYVANPYHILTIHRRFAFAELLASSLFPFLLLCITRIANGRRYATSVAALTVAAVWLTNVPGMIVATYSTGLVILALTWQRRSWSTLLRSGVAFLVGTALAGVYLIPAQQEVAWVNPSAILRFQPSRQFLFLKQNTSYFAMNLNSVAVAEIAVLLLAYWWKKRHSSSALPGLAPLFWMGVFAFVMTAAISAPVWHLLPRLSFVQFPWRFLVPLSFAFAVMSASALGMGGIRERRVGLALVLVSIISGCAVPLKRYLYDPMVDVVAIQRKIQAGAGYLGYLEYLPPGAQRPLLPPQRQVTPSDLSANVAVEDWGTELKRVRVQTAVPVELTFSLFDNPHWVATINGEPADHSRTAAGLISMELGAGISEVELRFREPAHVLWGAMVSAIGVFALVGIAVIEKQWVTGGPRAAPVGPGVTRVGTDACYDTEYLHNMAVSNRGDTSKPPMGAQRTE